MDKSIKELFVHINGIIAQNKDDRTKEIGDRVKVWDGSGNVDKVTGKHRYGIDPLFNNTAIVVETGCNIEYRDKSMSMLLRKDWFKVCDLLLAFPSGELVYCSSEFVKRVD